VEQKCTPTAEISIPTSWHSSLLWLPGFSFLFQNSSCCTPTFLCQRTLYRYVARSGRYLAVGLGGES
jgi:hypothetical protein